MSLVIIIPTYNEKENITRIIEELFAHVPYASIVVVDDNSPDGTGGIVQNLQKKYPRVDLVSRIKKEGLGKAYSHAFAYVLENHNPSRVVMMDADLSHQPHYVAEMDKLFSPGMVIVGSRYVDGGGTVGWETWRRWLSYYGNLYSRTVTGIPVGDLTAGFYMIDADMLRMVDSTAIASSGYAFQIELKYLLKRAGAQFVELPIVFVNRVGGESKISNHIVREGLVAPWRIRLNAKTTSVPVATRTCIICGSTGVYWGAKNSHNMYSCPRCGLLFVDPLPDTSKIYSTDYFSGAADGFGYVNYDTDKEPMRPVFEKYLNLTAQYAEKTKNKTKDKTEKQTEKQNKKILDIGAATGFFLDIARAQSYEVQGIEMSAYAAARAQEKGIPVQVGDLLSHTFPSASFDVVYMLDVLEHMTDPLAEIDRSCELLAPNGLLLVNTPNGQSMLSRILKSRWHLVVPPEHLHYFSPKNLTMYLESHGFEVVYEKTIGKRFTFSYIFQTLYKWQKLSVWAWCTRFSERYMPGWYVPINLFDNFFLIARKK